MTKLDWFSCAVLGLCMTAMAGALYLAAAAVLLSWPAPEMEDVFLVGFFVWVLATIECRYPTPAYWW